eukprot:XP_011611694.1 PREDICTED: MICOS complex subunit MIC19 isoform X1 [Takifugu rubripes]
MGGKNSTHRVSFESDENDNITVVKGIRLSENVINRMRETSTPPPRKREDVPPPPPPLLRPVPPLFDPITSLPPPPPVVEPVAPPSPPPPTEQVAAPTIIEMVCPSPSPMAADKAVQTPASEAAVAPALPNNVAANEPVTLPSTLLPPSSSPPVVPAPCPAAPEVKEDITHSPLAVNQPIAFTPPLNKPLVEPIASSSSPEPIPSSHAVKIEPILFSSLPESEPLSSLTDFESVAVVPPVPPPCRDVAAPPLPESTPPCEPFAHPSQSPVEPVCSPPVAEPAVVSESSSAPPPPPAPAVDEEALRKKITDELYKGFEQDRAKAGQELQAWLEEEKARTRSKVQAETQSQVQDEISRILSAERGLAQESLQQAIIRERLATEDEKRRAELFAKQLSAREADLQKQDAFYREQVARLEERSAQFYKVTTENYHKAADQVNAKYKRYEIHPVCADLQGRILTCYKENAGKTLNCSNIASLYLQCVNNAKQNKLRTGG